MKTTLTLFLFLASPGSLLLSNERPPNFIVIFCDNLGYGDIEPFGSTLHRTPHLNRMAEEGMKFTHFCVTAGVCTPSRASLISGILRAARRDAFQRARPPCPPSCFALRTAP